MVKGKEHQGSPTEPTNPTQFAETPPPLSSGDYSFLEIVMAMQHAMGQLTEAVNGLKSKQEEQGRKLEAISHKVYAAVAIVLVLGAILTFFAKSINDTITNRLLAPVYLQQAIPTPTTTPTPQRNVR